jgi:hypothetical protein
MESRNAADKNTAGVFAMAGLKAMKSGRGGVAIVAAIALLLPWVAFTGARAGNPAQADKSADTTRLTVEVTGGGDNKPVSDASVYVKYVAVAKHAKDKKIELNLKTNQEGVAHSPEIPQGKVLIQIVAPGWKTFGQYYDTQSSEQTIPIHLERPTTKWY